MYIFIRMDASKITELLQKQNTRYISRCQTTDSSTLTWKNQIQSSKYIKGVKTCEGEQNWNVPTNPACSNSIAAKSGSSELVTTGVCSFGGAGRTTAIQTGSKQQFLSVLSGASGSASEVYSSERILLQKAGKESCAVLTSSAQQNAYIVLPACYCVDTNGPTTESSAQLRNPTVTGNPSNIQINNQSNPYLPAFDTYYAMKNPQCKFPIQDQNQKHYVKKCNQCPEGEQIVGLSNTHEIVIEPIYQPSIYYDLCIASGEPPLPTLPIGSSQTVTIIGSLPMGGTFSIIIVPSIYIIGQTLPNIDSNTGTISWPIPGPTGGTYTVIYSGPNIIPVSTTFFMGVDDCAI